MISRVQRNSSIQAYKLTHVIVGIAAFVPVLVCVEQGRNTNTTIRPHVAILEIKRADTVANVAQPQQRQRSLAIAH